MSLRYKSLFGGQLLDAAVYLTDYLIQELASVCSVKPRSLGRGQSRGQGGSRLLLPRFVELSLHHNQSLPLLSKLLLEPNELSVLLGDNIDEASDIDF